MGLKSCLLLLLVWKSAAMEIVPIQNDWVLARQPLKWQSPPRVLQSKTRTALAELLILVPSGAFARVSCYLIRQQNGEISISRGDSHAITVGTWKLDGTVLSA